jgi:hypothetical protein
LAIYLAGQEVKVEERGMWVKRSADESSLHQDKEQMQPVCCSLSFIPGDKNISNRCENK